MQTPEHRQSTVSVVIATKDREQKLVRLINALQAGTLVPQEIIIVNDAGAPLTAPTIHAHATVITNTVNRGPAFSRSLGARKSRGEYVLFIDDDNVPEASMLAELVGTMDQFPHCGAVGPATYYLDHPTSLWFLTATRSLTTSKPTFIVDRKRAPHIAPDIFTTDLLHNCALVRRTLGSEADWFDPTLIDHGSEYELFLRIKRQHPDVFFATNGRAIDYHDVPKLASNNLRAFGLHSARVAYIISKNRGVIIGRHGHWWQRMLFGVVFYPLFTALYIPLFIRHGAWQFLWAYIAGMFAGYRELCFPRIYPLPHTSV